MMEPGMLNVAQKVSLHHPGTHTHTWRTHKHTHTQAEQRGCSACETCGRQTGGGLIPAGAPSFHGSSDLCSRWRTDASLPDVQTPPFYQHSSKLKTQVADSLVHSSLLSSFRSFSQQMKFKALLSVVEEENVGSASWQPPRSSTLLSLALLRSMLLQHCMLATWVHSHSVLSSSAFVFGVFFSVLGDAQARWLASWGM